MPVVENAKYAQQAQILIFALLCTVNFFLIKPLNVRLETRLSSLRIELLGKAEAFLHRKISYDSIGANIFSVIDIKNLVVSGDQGDDSSPLLSIPRIKIHWSIGALAKSLLEENLGAMTMAVRGVVLENPSINLDMERDEDLLSVFASLQSDSPSGKPLELSEGVPLKIRNGSVVVSAQSGELKNLSFTGVKLDAIMVDREISFDMETDAALVLKGASYSASTAISGASSADFKDVNARISLLSLSSDLFSLATKSAQHTPLDPTAAALSFNVSASNGNVHVSTVNNPMPFDISLSYQPQSKDLSLAFLSERFTPADFISLSGGLQKYQQYLGLTLSGSADCLLQNGGFQYTASLSGSLPDDFPTGRADFIVKGLGDEKSASFSEAALSMPRGVLGFYGSVFFSPLALDGRISISNFTINRHKKANASFIATANERNASLRGESVSLDKTILKNPEVQVSFGKKSLDWSLSIQDILFEGEVNEEEASAEHEKHEEKIIADGVFDYNPRQMDARLVLNDVALSKLFGAAESVAATPELPPASERILNNTVIQTEAFFSTDFKRFSYNVPTIDVVYNDVEKNERVDVVSSLSGTNRRLDLALERIAWNNGEVNGDVFVNFSGPNNIGFGLSFSYLQNSYSIQGSLLDNYISIQGSYNVNAFLVIGEGLSGYIEAVNAPFPFQGKNAYLSLKTFMRYEAKDSWSVDVESLEVVNLWSPISPSNTVRLSAHADQNGVQFPVVFWNDGTNSMDGSVSLKYAGDFSQIDGVISMADDSKRETYQVDFSCMDLFSEDRFLEAHLQGADMKLERFIPTSYGAVLSGRADVYWRGIENFSAYVELPSAAAVVNDVGVRLKCAMNVNNNFAEIRDLEAHYGSISAKAPFIRMSLDGKRVETEIAVGGTTVGKDVELAFALDMDFDAAVDTWLGVERIVDSFKGRLAVEKARFDTLKTESPFAFDFSHADNTMYLTGGPNDMLRMNIADSGDFYAGLSAPSPVRGSINGNIDAKNIDAICRNLYIDLAALWKLIPPQKDIALTGGFVNADIEIRGPLSSPEFFGRAIGDSVRLQVPTYLKRDIRPVPMLVTFNGTNMSFGPIPASIGAGYGVVSGVFHFDRWAPDVFTIDIAVEEANAIPFDFDIMGVIAAGDAFGELTLAQSEGVFHVSGDLTAQNSEITLNGEELEAAQNQPVDANFPSTVNITVRTGSKVEFLWPTVTFPLIRAYADQGVSLNIQNDTITGRFALVGDVRLRSGEIFYFERSFYLREGLLSFNENEVRFEPHISARAEVRDRSDEGAVTISMIIDNAPLWSFNPRFESNPPLSQMAIFELLGQTMMSGVEEGGASGRMAGLSSLTDLVAQIQGVRQVERRLRNWLYLDMFSLRTQVMQNLLFQSSMFQSWVQQSEPEQAESSDRPGNLLDNTTVFIGKYLTKDMFFQLMLSLRYDESAPNVGGLTLEPDFGLELQNPLFDMRWSFVPLHPENLFVNDMSFTLTWSKNV
jgi:hypothetical protein